jgi:putative iron-dependent peroxidase
MRDAGQRVRSSANETARRAKPERAGGADGDHARSGRAPAQANRDGRAPENQEEQDKMSRTAPSGTPIATSARGMRTPQAGIFALGTASHTYLEFDSSVAREPLELVAAIASLREPRTTMGGVNLVAGFRPELWRTVAPDDAPDAKGLDEDLLGVDGFVMPATQHDAVLWLSGSAYDVVFDVARMAIRSLAGLATIAEETSSWPYRHDLDLTGFIDGTENPTLMDAPEFVLVAEEAPGAGGTILLLQKWAHDAGAWEALSEAQQELVIGRRKLDSVELEDKPDDSHVASTDQDRFGKIFRRNMPYGTVTDHGTMFVGFCSEQRPLAEMLESMAGQDDGTPDALTRYTRPLTGAYYFVPSTESLRRFSRVDRG